MYIVTSMHHCCYAFKGGNFHRQRKRKKKSILYREKTDTISNIKSQVLLFLLPLSVLFFGIIHHLGHVYVYIIRIVTTNSPASFRLQLSFCHEERKERKNLMNAQITNNNSSFRPRKYFFAYVIILNEIFEGKFHQTTTVNVLETGNNWLLYAKTNEKSDAVVYIFSCKFLVVYQKLTIHKPKCSYKSALVYRCNLNKSGHGKQQNNYAHIICICIVTHIWAIPKCHL